MYILKFPIDGVRKIYEHSKDKINFLPSLGDLFEHRYLKEGIKLKEGEIAKSEHIDDTKVAPRFDLVHDSGIYLMAATKEPLLREGEVATENVIPNFVVYAEGFNPDKDADYYEAARYAVGGDDFSEPLPLEWMGNYLEEFPDADYFYLGWDDEAVELLSPKDVKRLGG